MVNDDQADPGCCADALVVRARTDRESFGKLYDLYYDRIYRYCVHRLFRSCLAEEACSEVFLYVAGHFGQFRGTTEKEFRGWLYGIATNTINAHVRRTRRRGEIMKQAIDCDALATSITDNAHSDDEPLDWPRLYHAIAQLRPREQTIVTLRFFEGWSHEEIAATLKLKPGAMRVALSRAIDKLRRQLMPRAKPSNASHDK